ncbi:MAG TPA: hypothetical protein VIJ12_00240 [Candidatus Baltobacteraceae bacterium]
MPDTVSPAVAAALTGLIDYAGLFPPAALSVDDALRGYGSAQDGSVPWLLGRFIAPASRLDELRAARGTEALAVSAIVDGGADPRRWFDLTHAAIAGLAAYAAGSIRVESIEVPLPPLASARETYGATIGQLAAAIARDGLDDVAIYVELVRDARWTTSLEDAMTSLARHGLAAKVRCGGATADAYPSCEELAAFVIAAVRAGVPFKATAGLHHPVRRLDPQTGILMHGFLNLLAASLVALHEDDPMGVESALGEEDAGAFTFGEEHFSWRDRRYDVAALARARNRGLVAYGSCSFDEPVADLAAMGVRLA